LHDPVFRALCQSEWPQILRLANESVAQVDGAGEQSEWLANRRSFPLDRHREQFVAVRNGTVVGYAAMEATSADDRRFRLFVVTSPSDRPTIGSTMLNRLFALLHDCGAEEARFVEYSSDTAFLEFLAARGFAAAERISLNQNTEAVAMVRGAPFL
jgi:N-acetylglutamate synthase-like GNAT family acetyltransferase